MNIGIVGAGTMGSGIAQVACISGCKVIIFDKNPDAQESAKLASEKNIRRFLKREKKTEEELTALFNNIHYTENLEDFKDVSFCIEAIIEKLEVKKKVFQELETIVSTDAVLATNTSSLSISSIASALVHPERCLGVHFFNPAIMMPLVEIIPAVQTSKDVFHKVFEMIQSWNKVAVKAKDTPGFIVNRVARPFYGEALRILEEGIADVPTIDWAITKLGKFRMGPFQLMDFIGNDVNYTVTETVFEAFYFDPRYKPSFTQKRLAEAGYLGKKSGKGFYDYENKDLNAKPNEDEVLGYHILNRILVMLINEAADALYLNIASAKDIDLAMTNGVNYPKGLLAWANEKTLKWCEQRMDDLYKLYKEDRYRCSPLIRRLSEENKSFDLF